jgi:DNA-binding MarR family transcriptional regulator
MARMDSRIDPHIHQPARLLLVTMLTAVSEAEFVTLRDALDVSDSVLSKHVSALAEVGYVRSRKGSREGRRTTWIALTKKGERALRDHAAALRALLEVVDPV